MMENCGRVGPPAANVAAEAETKLDHREGEKKISREGQTVLWEKD